LWAAIWLVRQKRYADARIESRSAFDLGAPAIACELIEELTEDTTSDERREALQRELGLGPS
jgi:hypothetical protein